VNGRDYTVVGQRQTRATMGGQLVDVYDIDYEGPNGITGSVRVPVRTASEDQVDTLIRRQLDTQLGISQLGAAQG
jgi:hypothetical protein